MRNHASAEIGNQKTRLRQRIKLRLHSRPYGTVQLFRHAFCRTDIRIMEKSDFRDFDLAARFILHINPQLRDCPALEPGGGFRKRFACHTHRLPFTVSNHRRQVPAARIRKPSVTIFIINLPVGARTDSPRPIGDFHHIQSLRVQLQITAPDRRIITDGSQAQPLLRRNTFQPVQRFPVFQSAAGLPDHLLSGTNDSQHAEYKG